MFKFWETYTVYCYRSYDENELKTLANRYDDYISDYAKYHGIEKEDSIDTFSDFIIDEEYFYFHDNYDYDFEDSNIQDLYDEIKKYM